MKKILWIVWATLSILFSTRTMAEPAKNMIILDVRTPEEYKENHLIGSQNIDWNQPDFKSKVEQLDKSASYKLYCRSGNRSAKAVKLMKTMGFTDLEDLGGVSDASKKLKIACEGPKPC